MKIAIFGASGHGGDVADIAIDNGYNDIIFLDKNEKVGKFCSFEVIEDNPSNVKSMATKGFNFAIGIGEPKIRKIIYNKYPTLVYPTIIHSAASIGNLKIDGIKNTQGTVISAGSRITNNTTIGNFCFLGVNSVIGHDCDIQDFVSLMPCAVVSGNVTIKVGAYVGCNASIRQGNNKRKLSVGEYSTIGMGAVVLNDVPDNNLAIGVPAINSLRD